MDLIRSSQPGGSVEDSPVWGRGPFIADMMLGLCFTALMVLEVWVFDTVGPLRDRTVSMAVIATVLSLVAGMTVSIRRVRPWLAFGLNTAAIYALVALTTSSDFYQFSNVVVVYTVAMLDRSRLSWLAVPLSVGGVVFYFLRFPEEGSPVLILAVGLFWVIAWLAGRMSASYVERNQLQIERDLSSELAETRRVRLELETERTQMARELHDIVGHTLNVMLVHAGAARRALPNNVGQATEALEIIEKTGRSAMDDLDRVLGLLREPGDGEGRAPLPGIGDLADLAAHASDDDLQVDLELSLDAESIPRPIQLTIYRITQEALTNARRHARAGSINVSLDRIDDVVELTVTDDGIGIDGARPGRGLTGMMQRAQLHGGTVTTTALTPGTALRCRIPLHLRPAAGETAPR